MLPPERMRRCLGQRIAFAVQVAVAVVFICGVTVQSVHGQGTASRRPTLADLIGTVHKTDKHWRHGYHRYYEPLLAPYRDQDGLALLEIGVRGGHSLLAWIEYFTDVHVDGGTYKATFQSCDLGPQICDRMRLLEVDQSKAADLAHLKDQQPAGWDIIIDDGSHVPEHQIITFSHLWGAVRPGGVFVCEDIETSYGAMKMYGYDVKGGLTKPVPQNAVEFFKVLADVVSRKHFFAPDMSIVPGDETISSVEFADGLIIVRKAPEGAEFTKYPRDLATQKQAFDMGEVKALQGRIRGALPAEALGAAGHRSPATVPTAVTPKTVATNGPLPGCDKAAPIVNGNLGGLCPEHVGDKWRQPGDGKAARPDTLIVVTTSVSLWHKTELMLLSLARATDDFDVSLIDDSSVKVDIPAEARALGVHVIDWPSGGKPHGLTRIWNEGWKYAVKQGYKHVIMCNNDLLVPSGTIDALTDGLRSGFAWINPMTTHRGSHYAHHRLQDHFNTAKSCGWSNQPFAYQGVQDNLVQGNDCTGEAAVKITGNTMNGYMMAFNVELMKRAQYDASTQTLFDPRKVNTGNEDELIGRVHQQAGLKTGIHRRAFVFHYKGSTINHFNGGRDTIGEKRFNHDGKGTTDQVKQSMVEARATAAEERAAAAEERAAAAEARAAAAEGQLASQSTGSGKATATSTKTWEPLCADDTSPQMRASNGQGKTALVTGASGFIGSHVARHCAELGMTVIAVDDMSGGFVENIPEHARLQFIQGDVKDATFVDSIFQKYQVDFVYHLAAYAAEGLSHFIRSYNYRNNLVGSIELVNQAVKHKVECFVFTSSIAVYGPGQTPMIEETLPMPEDPYGISKYAVEMDLHAAKNMFGMDFVIFRPHNVYGPGQNMYDKYRNVIGIFFHQRMEQPPQPMTVFGDGDQTRAFSYIDDVAPVIAKGPLVPAARNQVFNVGADTPYTVNTLATEVASALGQGGGQTVHLPPRKEVYAAFSDHSKARCFFRPPTPLTLTEGIAKMAEWVREVGVTMQPVEFAAVEVIEQMPPSWVREDLKEEYRVENEADPAIWSKWQDKHPGQRPPAHSGGPSAAQQAEAILRPRGALTFAVGLLLGAALFALLARLQPHLLGQPRRSGHQPVRGDEPGMGAGQDSQWLEHAAVPAP